MPKIPAAAANPFPFSMLDYRYHCGQFTVPLTTISLSGSDVLTFLSAQTTFDTKGLSANSFHLISLLDPQGRIVCYGWLLRKETDYSLLVPPALESISLERLNLFLISEDVVVESQGEVSWLITMGPDSQQIAGGYRGEIFDDIACLENAPLRKELPLISPEEIELWRGLTGWPSFDAHEFHKTLINNLRLYDLSVSQNKGCYPGQETVSKIATRRGAAYYPILIESNLSHPVGPIFSFDKKIGEIVAVYEWQNKYFLAADLIRDFRVEGMELNLNSASDASGKGIIRYYPLLSGRPLDKAQELFYSGIEHFRLDRMEEAKRDLQLAIKLSPDYADAYESLGVILGREEKFQQALGYMQKLAEIDPTSVLAHTNMSLYLMRLGRIEEAEEQKSLATVKSFQQFGSEAKRKEELAAQNQRKADEWQQREQMFLQVLEIDEEDPLANYGIGAIAVEKGDWQRAQVHLQKVLKTDPGYSVAYLALGKAYASSGNTTAAIDIYRQGIVLAAKKGDLMPANQMQMELDQLLR